MEEYPSHLKIVAQILFMMVCEDFCYHIFHRCLHHPLLYPYIHKKDHEHPMAVSISAEYASPVEFFLNLLTTNMGGKILGRNVHIVTVVMSLSIRIIQAVDDHCGYNFPWSPFRLLPFRAPSSYHNFHHSHNVGNYSTLLTIWDTLFGSNKAYYSHLKKIAEKNERPRKESTNIST